MRIAFVLPLVLLAACGDPAPEPPAAPAAETADAASVDVSDGILGLAAANPSLGTFSRAVEAAGLTDELAQEGPVTVFAPSDAAFDELGDLDALMADPEALATRLRGHVVPTRMLAVDVFAPIGIETVAGGEIEVDAASDGQITVRSGATRATVVTPDLDASNGVIHIIDAVL